MDMSESGRNGRRSVSKGVITLPHRQTRGVVSGLVILTCLLSLCSLGAGRPLPPISQALAKQAVPGLSTRRPLAPEEFPELLKQATFHDRAAQGAGADPDKQLTPTAVNSLELDAATPGLEKVARLAFVTDGVDEWINDSEPDPKGPPAAPDDPDNIPDGQIDRWGQSQNGFNIWVMRHDGTQQVAITDMPGDERDPAYDPGGTVLAFVNNQTGTYQIYTVDFFTKTVTQITTDPGNKASPSWSADGTTLVYATDVNGAANRDIFALPSTGIGAPTPLAATVQDESEPMVSPNGQSILFTRDSGTATNIWSMFPDGSNQEQLTNGGGDPTANDKNPSWRQDGIGMSFAIASDRLSDILDTQRDFNIWSVGASGEILGSAATLHTNTDPTDTRDDIMPAFSALLLPVPAVGPNRAPMRLFFTSLRMDEVGPPDGTAEPDIWGRVIEDDRPPTLLDLPTVSDRNPTPGSDVIVAVRPFDDEHEDGIQSVFAWFKDPDSADDDAQGIEHKIYPSTGGGAIPQKYFETVRSTNDACDGDWFPELELQRVGNVELFDDGDLVNSGDALAGDGIYSGIWTTPSVPSDFVIDIEVTDIAGNFSNFDDIYGLSTVSFAPRSNVLLVNDYCEGQAFLAAWGITNEGSFGGHKESYITLNRSGQNYGAHPNTISDGPYGEPYDLWRIICRGAPDLSVLQYYMSTSETQLTTDLTDLREVPVANRCVFWVAPHTGTIWAGKGTIVDSATQALLTTFVQRGGRLCVTGQDIAWALTLNGAVSNSFVENVLGARFVRDDSWAGTMEWRAAGVANDPVSDDPWGGNNHWPADDDPTDIIADIRNDASMSSLYSDVIQASGSTVVYNYSDGTGGVAGVRKEDITSGSRVVFLAFPFEAIHRNYDTGDNCRCRNRRSKLAHNILCYLRTGGLQGRVVGQPGLQPITDPEPIVTIHEGGTIIHAQRCMKDGTYVISGVPPGIYTLEAVRPGYKIDKPNSISIHGGLAYPTQDFVIFQDQPGAIQGTVTSLATGDPVGNATITAVSATDPLAGPTIAPVMSAADGTYVIPDVPTGDWDVTADGATSTPPYGTDTATVTVIPGGVIAQDFQLDAADGTLEVTVRDAADQKLLKDATVEATLNNAVVASGLTDAQGLLVLDVPPGTYDVIVDRAGYARETATAVVLSVQTTSITVDMTSLPGGQIAGQIYRVSAPDSPMGGVTIQILVGGTLTKQTTSADTWTYPGGGDPRFNFYVDDVPAGGQIEVRALRTGFTVAPASRVVVVSSGVTTYNVDFTVSALHTFPAGLQFISVPFDYSSILPEIVLSMPAGQTLDLAAYDPGLGNYAIAPRAPADRLRLGVAYWLSLQQAQDLVSEGTRATSPFLVPLARGWNGIGNPFLNTVDLYSLQVRDQAGVVRSIQEAFSLGLVRNGLYAYGIGGYRLATSLASYTGYWFYADEDVTLVFTDPGPRITSVGAVADRPALQQPADGWLAPIEVWSAGMVDSAAAFGVALEDADRLSLPKPPRPLQGAYVYSTLTAPGGGAARAVDVRTPGPTQTWELNVQTTALQGPVAVTWPDLTQLPPTARPILRDPATGQEVYMRTQREYVYEAGGEPNRTLEIEVTDDPNGVLVVAAAAAVPQGDGATISYTLSRDAQVTVSVHNLAGRPVAQPVATRPMTAGRNETVWTGQTSAGVRAAAGKYLIKVTAHSDDGQVSSALMAVNLRR